MLADVGIVEQLLLEKIASVYQVDRTAEVTIKVFSRILKGTSRQTNRCFYDHTWTSLCPHGNLFSVNQLRHIQRARGKV